MNFLAELHYLDATQIFMKRCLVPSPSRCTSLFCRSLAGYIDLIESRVCRITYGELDFVVVTATLITTECPHIIDGKFAAMMQVSLCNDGPITIILDTRSPEMANGNPNPVQRNPQSITANAAASVLTPEERIEQGKEKAKASREKRVKAKLDWEAKKRLQALENGGTKDESV